MKITKTLSDFRSICPPDAFRKKASELDSMQKENPDLFNQELLMSSRLFLHLYFARQTITVREFASIIAQFEGCCSTAMADFVYNTSSINTALTIYDGCAKCPLKSPIPGLEDYYPEDSTSWCPVLSLKLKAGHMQQLLDIKHGVFENSVSASDLFPKDEETLKKTLNTYLELEEYFLKHQFEKKEEIKHYQSVVREAIQKLRDKK